MKKGIDGTLWDFLDNRICLFFGEECFTALIRMLIFLVLKSVFMLVGWAEYNLENFIIFCPFFQQFVYKNIRVRMIPVLNMRIAESISGRLSPFRLLVTIPAHVFGSILALAIFRVINPFSPILVYKPFVYDEAEPFETVAFLSTFLYTIMYLVVPDFLQVNTFDKKWLSVPIVPTLLLNYKNCNTLYFEAAYALWFLDKCNWAWSPLFCALDSTDIEMPRHYSPLQLRPFITPLLAAIAGGFLINALFPEDGSWIRKKTYM